MTSVVNDFTFKDTFNTNDFEMYYLFYSPWDVNEDYHVVKQRYSKKIDLLNKSIIAPYFLLNKKKFDYLVVVPNRLKLK